MVIRSSPPRPGNGREEAAEYGVPAREASPAGDRGHPQAGLGRCQVVRHPLRGRATMELSRTFVETWITKPADFGSFLNEEVGNWGAIVKSSNVKSRLNAEEAAATQGNA